MWLLLCCLVCAGPRVSGRDWDIALMGAVGDGATRNTAVIQQAIDSAAAQGGGRVIVPTGVFVSGSLSLKAGVTLYLSAGAVLQGSSQMADYASHGHFIYAHEAHGAAIAGMGTIDGNGHHFWDESFATLDRPLHWIQFEDCERLVVEDVTLRNAPSHVLVLDGCRHVRVSGIRIENIPQSPNTDGIDVTDSRDVRISDCYIATGDDAICLKSDTDTVTHVLVSHCILESDDAAIKLGTGSKVLIAHCDFSGIQIRRSRYGLAMFMQMGGVYRDCTFRNIRIETGGRHELYFPIYLDIDRRLPEHELGQIRNMVFSGIDIYSTGKILIAGQPDQPIEHLLLEDIRFYASACADFAKAQKPRGNKKYPHLATSVDLSSRQDLLSLGYIQGLALRRVEVYRADNACTTASHSLEGVQGLRAFDLTVWPQ
ncbi:MAG: glycoside hydrolase family 28 protein [Bacteroidia bacterium]